MTPLFKTFVLGATLALSTFACPNQMVSHLIRFQEDRASLERKYPNPYSDVTLKRIGEFLLAEQKQLSQVSFAQLARPDQVDFLLLGNHIAKELDQLDFARNRLAEIEPLIPFRSQICKLDDDLRQFSWAKASESAEAVEGIRAAIRQAVSSVRKAKVSPIAAQRAAVAVDSLDRTLDHWYRFYEGYDPEFTWWVRAPYAQLDKEIKDYANFLRVEKVDIAPDDKTTILGDPIGRDALLKALKFELIANTPEELVQIADREFDWCQKELQKATKELGFGTDTKAAIEAVKKTFVAPGDQIKIIHDMAVEAIEFVTSRDLLTVPELAKQTWRMEMMSPERQKTSPFFLGGETILVSYPTDTMQHGEKLMSLRGNNPHFSRATVQHELIPGHHLQQFTQARFNTHRQMFDTPFWVEGWALYWEFMLWDLNFPRNAQDRIGMLFWRMHRCARIIFSLRFHLGEMTPMECVDFLVDKVGHERENALAEVRRSFGGDYPPLYQAAYMLGALQIRELRHELVDSGNWKEKAFHDAVIQSNSIPIAAVRALMTDEKLDRRGLKPWKLVTVK